MSKRFGRNQRRKLREEAASLKEGIAKADALTRWHSSRADVLEGRIVKWAKVIRSQLGENDPLNERVERMLVPRLDARMPPRFEPRMPMPRPGFDRLLEKRDVAYAYVDTIVHEVEVRPDIMGFGVRIILQAQDHTSGYVIDKQTLDNGRRDPRFVEWLSQDIARQLTAHLNQGRLDAYG